MDFINQLSGVEYAYVGVFLLIYLLHFYRLRKAALGLGRISRVVVLKLSLRSVYLVLLLLALLGPTFSNARKSSQALGKDIFLAIDLSNSMNATDVQPTRLERMKLELMRAIDLLKNNRIGLVVFSSEAFLYSPLTYDTEALRLFVQQLSTNMMSHNGTNIREALQLISDKFKPISGRHVKAAVVLTDGEDFGEALPDSTLQQLVGQQISLYFWIVGAKGGSKIPLANNNGFKTDARGKEILSQPNLENWKPLAKQLNGEVFTLNSQVNDTDQLASALNALENTEIDKRNLLIENNRYYYFLWAALLLIFMDALFIVRVLKI